MAIDLIAERATAIPQAQAKAREELWTPGQDEPEGAQGDAAARLWTPDR